MMGQTPRPAGYWTAHGVGNMRKSLENFAEREGFDPLIADNWYYVSSQQLKQVKVNTFF